MIYLDSAATTKVADVVLEAMMPWLKDNYCNAGAVYKKGREAKAAIENAKLSIKHKVFQRISHTDSPPDPLAKVPYIPVLHSFL